MLDVVIIGSGPHALTLASLLSDPVDTYGEWAGLWERQFAALNIPHLRSHTLVHTDPLNQTSLQEFVLKHERSEELRSLPDQIYILDENAFFNDARLGRKEKKRLNIRSTLRRSLSFSLPGNQLSVDFFKHQVKKYKLDKILQKGTVERILPVIEDLEEEQENIRQTDRKTVKYFQVHLQDGSVLKARRVVMATGPTRAQMANVPDWVQGIAETHPDERLRHTVHLMHQLPDSCEAGQRVMVVGGGLTSAHVVSLALQQGASRVTWVMRKHLQLQLKQFDVGDVESLVGRYSHVEHGIKMDGRAYLRQFYNERSLHKRLNMIRQARKGGAITPEAYIHLQPFIQTQQVELKTFCQVSEASWCYRNQTWNLSLSSGDRWTGDMIWLATGCKLDVKQDPLLSDVMKEFPIQQVIEGWPCISESLQWTEGCPLYLMGQYAALQQVGPHAVNLAGGQAASRRIAEDIVHRQTQDGGRVSDPGGGKSRTEEYIQQMHGLFWL
uniref:L-ornithine N(5)-monooxygenase [NAD(P)H] n=1 Tax=Kryptolebias marmoratus TaxID=37003 RepID=A0A3Q3BJE6_KRYMA